MEFNPESLDYLTDDALEHICEEMDNQTLFTLLQSYKRSVSVCSKVLDKRSKIHESEFLKVIPRERDFKLYNYLKLNKDLINFFRDALKHGLLKGPNGERIHIDSILSGYSLLSSLIYLFKIYLRNTGRVLTLNVSKDKLLRRWFGYLEEPPLNYDIKQISTLIELTTEPIGISDLTNEQLTKINDEYDQIEAVYDLWR